MLLLVMSRPSGGDLEAELESLIDYEAEVEARSARLGAQEEQHSPDSKDSKNSKDREDAE